MANINFETKAVKTSPQNTLSRRVYEMVREEIVSGILKPGQRLTRRGLARKSGVSQNPVTEAIFLLEKHGFIENSPYYGSRVRELTVEDIENDQILREAIECQLVRLCCQNASDEEIQELQKKACELDRITFQGQPKSKLGMKMHFEFHMLIGNFSKKCPYLTEQLEMVWLRSLMRLNWIKGTVFSNLPADWHQQLVKSIKTRDLDKAEKKMREHVKMNEQYNIDSLDFLIDKGDWNEK